MAKPGSADMLRLDPGGSAHRIADWIATARADVAFRHYLDARDIACAMLDEAGGTASPVSAWMDAGPLTVAELRGAAGRELGDPPDAYKAGDAGHEIAVRALHAALAAADDQGLWLAEPDGLGQYGYPSDAGRLNLAGAALRYELLALARAGFLGDFLKGKRRVLAVVGAGWGGVARSFLARFPRSAVVLIDDPVGLLRATTYLRTVAPGLRLASVMRASIDAAQQRLADIDVLLMPLHLADRFDRLPIDVALLDAVAAPREAAAVTAALDRIDAAGCERVCAVFGRRSLRRRLTEGLGRTGLEIGEVVDWQALSTRIERQGGDPAALAAVQQLSCSALRR